MAAWSQSDLGSKILLKLEILDPKGRWNILCGTKRDGPRLLQLNEPAMAGRSKGEQ